jgi:dienelactone hydrolase
MPVLAADAKPEDYAALFPDAAQRIAAAVEYLHAKEYHKIALVSHSMGSRMTNEYVMSLNPAGTAALKLTPVAAWVALGMTADYRGSERFRVPVLDLYGADDLPVVLAGAARRRETLAKVSGSQSAVIVGADHYFNGHYKELDAEVRNFLDQALR